MNAEKRNEYEKRNCGGREHARSHFVSGGNERSAENIELRGAKKGGNIGAALLFV